jgi:TonB family protein
MHDVLLVAMMIADGLAPEQIRNVVVAHAAELRRCYDAELAHDSNLKGTITVGWRITPAGKVESATVKQSTMNNARVEQCVVRVVGTFQFAPAQSPTNIAAYPFKFGIAP